MSDQIRTIADLVGQVQSDREAILSGKVTEAQGRLLIGQQRIVLKGAELQLQYARLTRGKLPEPMMPLLVAAKSEKPETLPATAAA